MKALPQSLENLIDEFSKLPGIGRKTAERLSIYILKANEEQVFKFSETLSDSSFVSILLIYLFY